MNELEIRVEYINSKSCLATRTVWEHFYMSPKYDLDKIKFATDAPTFEKEKNEPEHYSISNSRE